MSYYYYDHQSFFFNEGSEGVVRAGITKWLLMYGLGEDFEDGIRDG